MFRTYCDILPQVSLYRTVYQNISNKHIFSPSLWYLRYEHTQIQRSCWPKSTLASRNDEFLWSVRCAFVFYTTKSAGDDACKAPASKLTKDTRSERLCKAFASWARWYFHIFHGLDVGFWKVVSRCFKYEPGLPAYTKIILAQRSHCLQQYRRAWSLVSCNVERPWLLDMAAICCNIDG